MFMPSFFSFCLLGGTAPTTLEVKTPVVLPFDKFLLTCLRIAV